MNFGFWILDFGFAWARVAVDCEVFTMKGTKVRGRSLRRSRWIGNRIRRTWMSVVRSFPIVLVLVLSAAVLVLLLERRHRMAMPRLDSVRQSRDTLPGAAEKAVDWKPHSTDKDVRRT
jgi:hypothetical protein